MTKEELYQEFLEVTHFDESKIISYEKFTKIENGYDEKFICQGVEGLAVKTIYVNTPFITYFHHPKLDEVKNDKEYQKLLNMFELIHQENIQIARGLMLHMAINNRSAAETMCDEMEERWNKTFEDIWRS